MEKKPFWYAILTELLNFESMGIVIGIEKIHLKTEIEFNIFLPEVNVPGLAQSCCTSVNSVPSPVQPNIKWS